MAVIDLANPTRFLRIVDRALPWLVAATVVLFAVGLYRAMNAPDDYQQGATVKIMFLHVPAASCRGLPLRRSRPSRSSSASRSAHLTTTSRARR